MSHPDGSTPPTTLALCQNDQTLRYVLKETQPSYSKGILDACQVMASIVGIAAVLKMIWAGSKYETRFKSLKQMLSAHKHATLRQQTAQNPYAVLGLDSTASPQQVETAYRQLALQYHPDKQLTYGAQRKATTQFLKISKAYATLTDDIKPPSNKKQGGRAKAKMTLSQARQQFKRTFSRKHRNEGQISKGTSKSKPTRTTKTKTGLRNIKHAVSTKNKHELAETLKQIRANESKQALNACLMLVPVFGMAAVIKMMAGGGSGSQGQGQGGNEAEIRAEKEKLLRKHMADVVLYLFKDGIETYKLYTDYTNQFEEKEKEALDKKLNEFGRKYLSYYNARMYNKNILDLSHKLDSSHKLDLSQNSFTITLPVRSRKCVVVTFDNDYKKIKNLEL